jgi:hypothetical protein
MTADERHLLQALRDDPAFASRGLRELRIVRDVRGNITRLHHLEGAFDDGTREHYWLKSYSGKPDDALAEWSFLQSPVCAGSYRLVEAVAYVRSLDAVVTRHAEGERLSDLLPRDPQRALAAVRDAGAWLGTLHRTERGDRSIHPRDSLIEDIVRRAGALRLDLRQTIPAIEARAAATPATDLLRVRTHGDYGPFNILVRADGGTIIDPSFEPSVARLENDCTRHEDYARFLTCITALETIPPEQKERAEAEFRSGYTGTAGVDPTISPALGLLRAKYGLQALLDGWPGFVAQARRRGLPALLTAWLQGTA